MAKKKGVDLKKRSVLCVPLPLHCLSEAAVAPLSLCLSVNQSVCQSVCLSVCLCLYAGAGCRRHKQLAAL